MLESYVKRLEDLETIAKSFKGVEKCFAVQAGREMRVIVEPSQVSDEDSMVLAREPRHFGALSGLGMILQELGDEKHALDAFRRALAVHPKLEKIPDMVKKLIEKVEGRDI